MSSHAVAVQAGAAFLDAKHPGWATKINLGTLDIFSNSFCVLGQLYTSYLHAVEVELGIDEDEAIRLGFVPHADNCASYDSLTGDWKYEIGTRQAA